MYSGLKFKKNYICLLQYSGVGTTLEPSGELTTMCSIWKFLIRYASIINDSRGWCRVVGAVETMVKLSADKRLVENAAFIVIFKEHPT